MARGPKKHLKRLRAPKHWMLDKLTGIFAPRPSTGPHKMRESLPLVVFLRDRLKYALTKKECQTILMNRLVKVRPPTPAPRAAGAPAPRSAWRLFRSLLGCLRLFFPAPWSSPQAACPPAQVDGKTRTDPTFPSGFMGARPPRAVLHAPQRGARSHRFGLVLPLGLQMWCRSTKPMNTFGCCTTPRGGLRFTASRRRRPRYAQSRPSTIAGAATRRRQHGDAVGLRMAPLCRWF